MGKKAKKVDETATNLPETLYAVREGEGLWLQAQDDFKSFDDGAIVGVYELVSVKTKHTAHALD